MCKCNVLYYLCFEIKSQSHIGPGNIDIIGLKTSFDVYGY